MPSDTDDNPFTRNSAWPKMPQAPFRVGPLPTAGEGAPATPPPPPQQTITPVFTRPVDPPAGLSLLTGGALPKPEPRPVGPRPGDVLTRPVIPGAPQPAVAPPPATVAAPPEPPLTEPRIHEVAEVVVYPVGREPVARRRKSSPLPGVAATLVGLAGIAGLVMLLNRAAPGPSAAPKPAPVVPAATAPADVPAQAPVARPVATPEAPPAPVVARAAPSRRPPAAATPARAEALAAPPPLVVPPVTPEPLPAPVPAEAARTDSAYVPPAAPDPNAPLATRRPY